MSRRRDDRPGQIGDYWLSRRPNSAVWCRTWFDATGRQTRRASLGSSDFREAQLRLAAWITAHREMRHERPQDVPLEQILVRYYREHASKAPSAEQARFHLRYWSEFFAGATVAELTPPRQEAFIMWLRESGKSDGYAARILDTGRAALNRAYKRQELDRVPFIMTVPDRAPAKERRRLSPQEVSALLTAAREVPHLLTFCMVALNTLARPDAILDLSPFQIDLENRRIDLNPAGRRQTKKHRPVVPITDTLLPWVSGATAERLVHWHGRPVASIKTAWRRIRDVAGLPADASPYSLRHTMATELRRRGVPEWEVSGMLGHKRAGITETYAKFSPSYLGEAARAIDAFFADLGKISDQTEIQIPTVRSTCVSVVAATGPQALETMVGGTGIEPVTPAMSTQCSTAELTAHPPRRFRDRPRRVQVPLK